MRRAYISNEFSISRLYNILRTSVIDITWKYYAMKTKKKYTSIGTYDDYGGIFEDVSVKSTFLRKY